MVTENVEMDLDITNGACGEIVGIVLHEDEPPIAQGAVVKLRYLPAYNPRQTFTDQSIQTRRIG
jgi:hypothetical protein